MVAQVFQLALLAAVTLGQEPVRLEPLELVLLELEQQVLVRPVLPELAQLASVVHLDLVALPVVVADLVVFVEAYFLPFILSASASTVTHVASLTQNLKPSIIHTSKSQGVFMPKRDLLQMAILTVVTLGFYQLYWLYKTRQELVAAGQKEVLPFKILFVPLLAFVVIAIVQVLTHFVFSVSDSALSLVIISSVVLGFIAFFALLPVWVYWHYKYCQAIEQVTGGNMTFGLSFGMLLLLTFFSVGFAWPFIIQDAFNKVASQETTQTEKTARA